MQRRCVVRQRQQLSARRRVAFHHIKPELLAKPEQSEEDEEINNGRFKSERSEGRVSN